MLAPVLASLTSHVGYVALVALVGVESAGIPVPGETALITAGILASDGRLAIPLVIVLAAVAAIAGDNVGYLFGKRFGRQALVRPGWFMDKRRRALAQSETFFARHGAKAVFFGRWITGLRVWAAWFAGATGMRWPSFFVWNALGGIAWALTVGLAAYVLGETASRILGRAGLGALVLAGVVLVALVVRARRRASA
jgi:membrane protein DedA with SNARE-associated domain